MSHNQSTHKIYQNEFTFQQIPLHWFSFIRIISSNILKDYVEAAASMGIGLAFDPFNPEQKWNNRPTWQKAVLIIHLSLVAAMFGFGIGFKDK